jgi:hypothetical protein
MANLLRMALIETIFTLHLRGWSQRRIARELGIHRETVARHLLEPPPSKPAIAPSGSEPAPDDSKPAIAPAGSDVGSKPSRAPFGSTLADLRWTYSQEDGAGFVSQTNCQVPAGPASPQRGRQSACEPWRSVIEAKLALELSAQRIYQDLVSEHGFAGNYYNVRRFVAKLQPQHALPVRRLECVPGEEAQVDFRHGRLDLFCRGQAAAFPCPARRAQSFAEGIQSGRLSPDNRQLLALPGGCLLALWRRAATVGTR